MRKVVSAVVWLAVTILPMLTVEIVVRPSNGARILVKSRSIWAEFKAALADSTSASACSSVTLAFSYSIWVAPLFTSRS
ncbi:hypothetical protein D3C87_1892370 [compost metagenome]